MKQIKINNIIIGKDRSTVIIAETACKHCGNMDSARSLEKKLFKKYNIIS